MRKYLPILLAMAIGFIGCVTQTSKPQPPMPPSPPGMVTAYSKPAVPPGQLKKLQNALAALPPLKLGPAGNAFYDDFSVTPNTNWGFYQGTRVFTNGVLRMSAASSAGMYAWPLNYNWTNVSVSADVKMTANSWGAGVGARLNTNNGANYQAWIYTGGRMTIEKYPTDWYSGWQELGSATIPVLGATTNNVKLTISNNVITAYFNGVQKITYRDTSPITGGGTATLGIWGSGGNTTVADYDNVTVYNLDSAAVPPSPPVIVAGLTDTVGLKGLNTTLSVTATGNPLTYRWTLPNRTTVVGTNTYTITNVQKAGTYSVSVSNALGKVVSSAYLSVGTTNILTNCNPVGVTKSSVTLAWCPSAVSNMSYKIYYGTGTVTNLVLTVYDTNQPPCPGVIVRQGSNWCRCYTNVIDVGTNTTATVTNLYSGVTYYFAATAYDSIGLESDFSDEVSYTVPQTVTLPPTNAVLTITSLAGGAVQLQSKICPNELATIWYARRLNQAWSVLASNIMADVYGNFFYKNGSPTDQMRFYKLQPQ